MLSGCLIWGQQEIVIWPCEADNCIDLFGHAVLVAYVEKVKIDAASERDAELLPSP